MRRKLRQILTAKDQGVTIRIIFRALGHDGRRCGALHRSGRRLRAMDGIGDLRANAGLPEFSQEIQFLPLEGDRIAVQNVADGSLITTVEAGTDGLLRGALRGLGMSRNHSDFDLAAPYQLQRFAEDGVYLSDALTGRSIRLDSFGPLETGATADLLRYGHSGGN
jgi:putative photosynthetic complex assembly protein